jgi:hypothetical protein
MPANIPAIWSPFGGWHTGHQEPTRSGAPKEYQLYGRTLMPKKIDPLNKKNYSAVSAVLTVSDIKAAVSFYTKVFGFAKREL